MLKLIESNTIDPAEFTIVETIIKLVKYGVKSHNGMWAQSNGAQQEVRILTTGLTSETLKDVNLILRRVLGLEVDGGFILRRYQLEDVRVELPDHLTNIVDNMFGRDIYDVRDRLGRNDFYNRCCIIRDIITKNISYENYDLIELLEATI
jgi:hypothetical protein